MIKWILITIASLTFLAALLTIIVTRIEKQQFRENERRTEKNQGQTFAGSETAIVVFSRSGNTAVLAQHIADRTAGTIFRIQAPRYELGIPGWLGALADARNHTAEIVPEIIDLSGYRRVYLGAPIWLYSPAPPIWQFVRYNDLHGKEIILFNSFNSKFEQKYIDDFEALVRSKGAVSFRHLYVKRGRMGNQLSTEQMLKNFDRQMPE